MATLSESVGFGKRVVSDFSEKNVTFLAAALAYHAFISLAPMLLLGFFLLTTVGTEWGALLVQAAGRWLPGPIAEVVTQLFQRSPDGTGASIIGVLVLLWGTLKIFRGLDTAFSEIYETADTNTLVDTFRDGIVVVLALGLAVVAMVGSSIVLGGFAERIPNAHWLTPLALIVGLVIAFYPIYHVFPDADVGVRDVLPGVVVAAVGWAALQGLFQLYLAVADPTLGSLFGGVIVVVTYLYFSALVFLLGAVVNAVFGDHSTGRPAAIGRQRNGYVTERVESFDSDELDAYLGDLRAELTTADGDVRVEFLDGRPEPDGTVDIFEQSRSSDSGGEWTVTLRWTFID